MNIKYVYHYVADYHDDVIDSVIKMSQPVLDIGDYKSLKNLMAFDNGWSYPDEIKITSLSFLHKIELF